MVMQLNIRSLLSNQVELKQLLNELSMENSAIDVLLLSETFITQKTEKLINLKGYSIHLMNKGRSKGGSTAILIKSEIKHKCRKGLEIMMEKEAELTFIEMIAKMGRNLWLEAYIEAQI